ncbi:hypothetical protein [Streptomyces sp. FH025]|uniref:hypothetical protein n=1 Tax=Streptomyces sp. FH025 TaxID=2815937 RepID=UPI001A9FC54C|nr:hypothetical protein [Streptomyces sp. FH025]MBO1415550.1 hypothetical protein [Streptomyces sp. FH025]
MPPKKKAAPVWQAFPGAQEVMDRAVPLVAPAQQSRDFGPLAAVVFETALIFTNADGLPDLRRESYATRQWMSSLLDAAGIVAPPMSPLDVREAVKKDRQSLLQSIREAISPVRVNYVYSLDELTDERARLFPNLSSSEEIFAYYKIIPKTQREIRTANYHRKAALQSIGAAVLGADGEVPPGRCAEVVHSLHRTVAALSPKVFEELSPEVKDQLRKELAETRAALLALESALS